MHPFHNDRRGESGPNPRNVVPGKPLPSVAMHWTDFYVENGFAIVPGLVDRGYCDEALDEARRIVKHDLPVSVWTTRNTPVLYTPYFEEAGSTNPVFDRLLEQPRLVAAIETMFGGPGHWDRRRNYYLFLRSFNPDGRAALTERGHIDFGSQPVPILYRGFTFQVLLADNEPFSGNLTLHPGTHKLVQKALIDNPARQFPSGLCEDIPQPPPVEFVGRAGDVCFMHHLVFHSGNDSHSANRRPRVAIHAEAFRERWLEAVDPTQGGLSPWERSVACNGACRPAPDTQVENLRRRREYVETLRKQASGG